MSAAAARRPTPDAPGADARFRYRAATGAGAIVEGALHAPSREGALRELRRRGLLPVELEAERAAPPALARLAPPAALFGGAPREAVAVWVRLLATLLGAGTPVDRALDVAAGATAHPRVREAALDVRRRVQGGASLADALRGHPALFAEVHVGLVAAGEAGGALAAALTTLAGYLEEEAALRAELRAALLYPALMGVVALAGTLVLLLVVVPRFAALAEELGGTLPASTRVLVALGHAARLAGWALPVAAAAGVLLARCALAREGGRERWHALRLSLPVVGPLERARATARFTRALGLLLSAGLPLLPALQVARGGVGNLALAAGIGRAVGAVRRGERLAAALAGTLTPLAVQLLAVGEEGGRLPALALHAAEAHEVEARRTARTLAGLVGPALIVGFGALVGFVALAMLQAIYAVNTSIR